MTDSNHGQDGRNQRNLESWRGLGNDALDRELDAALTKYAAAEPRAGLEERVLENLRAGQERAAKRSWWRWPALAALAAVIVLAVSLVWKSGKAVQNITAQHPQATTQTYEHAGTQVVNNGGSGLRPHEAGPGRRLKLHPVIHLATSVTATKLEQFPSPQPLSEQERMLADYVAEHRKQAILVARARMAELKKDLAEEMEEASATSNHLTSDQSVSQQEDR